MIVLLDRCDVIDDVQQNRVILSQHVDASLVVQVKQGCSSALSAAGPMAKDDDDDDDDDGDDGGVPSRK